MPYLQAHILCNDCFQRIVPVFIFISISILSSGCASITPDGDVNDPIESVNRNIYQFNEGFDRTIMKPLALGYQKLPGPIQTGSNNFFNNLDDVVVIINDSLQLDIERFASDTLRFSVNTIFGIFGLIDVGTPMGLPKHYKSFADTLGYWGVGSGPYFIIPFIGPSSLRDAPSLIVDALIHPATLLSPTSAVIGFASVRAVNIRSDLLRTTDLRDEMAIDAYIFTREAYYQWRQNRIHNGEVFPRKVIIEDFEGFEDFEN
ncbi:MAG: VacJ family lipoprotein [gamma proteobacterium symbiont of Taylorina sp.]|nr:VacJ family lipoprotein [gamma proteobacterium symbiont of Taylorina sp.]